MPLTGYIRRHVAARGIRASNCAGSGESQASSNRSARSETSLQADRPHQSPVWPDHPGPPNAHCWSGWSWADGKSATRRTNQNALQQVDFLLLWKSLHCVVRLDCSIDAFENPVVGRMELGGIGKFRSVKFSHDPTSNLLILPTRSSYLFYLAVV